MSRRKHGIVSALPRSAEGGAATGAATRAAGELAKYNWGENGIKSVREKKKKVSVFDYLGMRTVLTQSFLQNRLQHL